MATHAQPVTEAEILAAVIAPNEPTWPPELANLVLGLRFTPEQAAQMRELAERNNAGELTDAERAELEGYVHVGNFLSLAHSKARQSLQGSEHRRHRSGDRRDDAIVPSAQRPLE